MTLRYHVVTWGTGYRLTREGARRATRVFPDGFTMAQSLGWYLLNRDCVIIVHDRDGFPVRRLGVLR